MHDLLSDDPDLREQRRAYLADLVRSGPAGGERRGHGRGRRAHDVPVAADPRSDAELRDRIQVRLGRLVSHPRAIGVQVDGGVVRLTGRVLAKERDGMLEQVRLIPGVQKLVDAMSAHHDPREIASRAPAAVPLGAATR
jgi:hypothetical protein